LNRFIRHLPSCGWRV